MVHIYAALPVQCIIFYFFCKRLGAVCFMEGKNLRLFYFLHFLLQSQCCVKKLWQLYLNSFLATCLMLICIVSDYTGCVVMLDNDNEL